MWLTPTQIIESSRGVMWLTLTQINESSCGRDIGMMGMWVWVDFNAKQPIINHTQINEP